MRLGVEKNREVLSKAEWAFIVYGHGRLSHGLVVAHASGKRTFPGILEPVNPNEVGNHNQLTI